MNKRKKIFVGAVLGTAVFAAVFASAASLNVSTETLGAGGNTVASCDTDVNVTYVTAYNNTIPGFAVGEVTVDGLADACAGLAYKIQATLEDGTNVEVDSGTLTLTGTTANAKTASITPSATLDASQVDGIYIVISG